MDNTVRSLIRFVGRGFYSKQYILILDAVLVHSVLSEDDLIYLLGIQRKELRLFCNKLVDDRLLTTHIQREENHQQRLISRTYYFIHITEAIDSIKWKVHSIVNKLKQEMNLYGNPHGFVCKRCLRTYSQLDAISLLNDDKSQFICDNCGYVLVEDDSNEQASIKQESLEKLMIQIDPIIAFLKKIDDSVIEDNNFESALVKSIPAQSSTSGNYSLSNRFKSKHANYNAANLKSQATLHVSITATDENEDKEQQEREEKRQKLQQNALPSWHSASTVGDTPQNSVKEETPEVPEIKMDPEVKPELESPEPSSGTATPQNQSELKDKEAQDTLAAYYAELAEREAEEDEDDDDEDDFEDI